MGCLGFDDTDKGLLGIAEEVYLIYGFLLPIMQVIL